MFIIIPMNEYTCVSQMKNIIKKYSEGKKYKLFFIFFILRLNIWEIISRAKTNCEIHKIVDK